MVGYARAAELVVTIFVAFLVLGFYLAHLYQSTGFFTASFTGPFVGLFFLSIFYPIINVLAKISTRNRVMLAFIEWVGAVLFATVAGWFFTVFPLNFVHVADVVPLDYRFIFSFFTNNEIGRIIVALVLLAGVIALLVGSIKLVWRMTMGVVRTTMNAV